MAAELEAAEIYPPKPNLIKTLQISKTLITFISVVSQILLKILQLLSFVGICHHSLISSAFKPLPSEESPLLPIPKLTIVLDLDATRVSAYKTSCLPDVVKSHAINAGQAADLVDSLKKLKRQARVRVLKDLRNLVVNHAFTRKVVTSSNGDGLICSLLGPFISHAVGSEMIGILVNLGLDSQAKVNLMQPARILLVVDLLNDSMIDMKINCTNFLEMLMAEEDFRLDVVASLRLLVGLMSLVKDKRKNRKEDGKRKKKKWK